MQAPSVSGDLLVKLVLGAVVLGATYYAVSKGLKGITDTIDTIKGFPGRVVDKAGEVVDQVVVKAKEGGAAWQDGYKVQPDYNYSHEGRNSVPHYGGKYNSPLVNDDGMDFGQLSG